MSDSNKRLRAQRRFGALVRSAPDAILVIDQRGEIVLANAEAERVFGYPRDELIGAGVETLMPLAYRAAHVGHREVFLAAPRARGMGSGIKVRGQRKDGEEIPIEVSLSPVSTSDGLWVVAALRDIGERERRLQIEQRNQSFVESKRLKTRFLANMSHELRTPLNAIIGFSELLHDEQVGPLSQAQKEFLGDILGSANHLLSLINGMLDLARVEAGKLELTPSTFAVEKVMAEVRDSVRVLASQKKLALSLEVEPGLGEVTIDPLRLKQVLFNYVANAIKFTPEGGVIMRARSEGANAFRVEVEDTGPGIAEHEIELLFVEFQQLQDGTARAHQGTGLGLALTKGIVEAQGGRVGVTSVLGRGSTFFAVLPLKYPHA